MRMLDLCSGMGGASHAMRLRDWQVWHVDNDAGMRPDFVADVREWSWTGGPVDLVWASPPCTEFSRESMPWCRTGNDPDMSIVESCVRIIRECEPRWWVIENVRGAVRWFQPSLGRYSYQTGPYYLWGWFPTITWTCHGMRKQMYSGRERARRAMIPYELSLQLALACEGALC